MTRQAPIRGCSGRRSSPIRDRLRMAPPPLTWRMLSAFLGRTRLCRLRVPRELIQRRSGLTEQRRLTPGKLSARSIWTRPTRHWCSTSRPRLRSPIRTTCLSTASAWRSSNRSRTLTITRSTFRRSCSQPVRTPLSFGRAPEHQRAGLTTTMDRKLPPSGTRRHTVHEPGQPDYRTRCWR